MKTPIQELIEEMEKSPLMFAPALALIKEKNFLEKEKGVIKEAYDVSLFFALQFVYDWGVIEDDVNNMSEDYYNKTFNTEEK